MRHLRVRADDRQRVLEVVRDDAGERGQVAFALAHLRDVVEHRDGAAPPVDVERAAADGQQGALGSGGVADDHLDPVRRLAGERPDQRQLLDRKLGHAVGPEDAVVLRPPVDAVRVGASTPEHRLRGGIVHQEDAVLVDHAHAVADPVEDAVEQRDLPVRGAFGLAQVGGGRDDPGLGAGPATGQGPQHEHDQEGQHRAAGADRERGGVGRAGEPGEPVGVGGQDQPPLPVGDRDGHLPGGGRGR